MRHVPRNTEALLLRRSGKTNIVLAKQRRQLFTLPIATLSQSRPATLTGSSSTSPISSHRSRVPPTVNITPAGKMTMSTSPSSPEGQAEAAGGGGGSDKDIHFGPFKVTNQVFLRTPHSFALVNLKPLLPGHVLVCPLAPHKRLTDLPPAEITDLFSTVQVVQRMLGRYYFHDCEERDGRGVSDRKLLETGGSFNIAVQDGPEAGQTVGHVHVHIIPRIRDVSAKDAKTPSDELYEWMAEEKGNVGGALWDRDNGHGQHEHGNGDGGHRHLQHSSTFGQLQPEDGQQINGSGSDVQKKEVEALLKEEEKGMAELQARPKPGGSFPRIEDAARMARGMEEMEREAAAYRRVLEEMGILSV
ncbi:Bis-triphosphatase [Pseudoneurospora amorphoporcata]|uniref:Bis(5'-adenosyl)-triphosphatase n=1 Tax=Pseudoneurospora amorphoporcata TaxID=241081 RepID=A0AAN6SHL0_9PEZI|nr:Bis-triphosphatase [Pseudoneurospora amorphoporcata]